MSQHPVTKNFPPPADAETRFRRRVVALGVLLGVGVALAGALRLHSRKAEAQSAAREELSAVADLKLRQIMNWREERMSDARFFSSARFVARDVRRSLDEPDSLASRAAVLDWLQLLREEGHYLRP